MENKRDKKIILIVEDEAPLLQAMRETFLENGYKVDNAKNGVEGLELAQRDRPDLIILDVLMPEMDGMTMIQSLRKEPWGVNVPVIILTNVNPESNKILDSIIKSKPAYYLIKSNVDLADIVEKVKSVLENSST
ncbi:MAG TPA: response regulator [Candidatus Saccharimonadales bacterium]|nr:response regulator [Candidatus Saccharimonadales bacterium]